LGAGLTFGWSLSTGGKSALGLLFVHYINEIHTWLGKTTGLVIWNPEVYAFDTIPNTMNPHEVFWIVLIAIASSVLGALVPAIRAARMNPVCRRGLQ
jgi:lipoprotein-releasing system permease protein